MLQELTRKSGCRVSLSIPFAKDDDARAIEPFASPPSKRFETIRLLSDAGIDTAVAVAPIIPGLNDDQIPEVLQRAKDAGASAAFKVLVRLPREVAPIFEARLAEAFPLRRGKVMNAIRETRGGRKSDSRFASRMVGQGVRWLAIEKLFSTQCERLGLVSLEGEAPQVAGRQRESHGPQLPLVF